MPHDVIVAADGTDCYYALGEQIIGRLDPNTGNTVEDTLPTLKPGSPGGSLALRSGSDGGLWIGMPHQAGVARFDAKKEALSPTVMVTHGAAA